MARFSDDEVRRYSRQMVLPELGGVGQEQLRATVATAQSELEALYLAAAGVGELRVPVSEWAAAARALNPLCTLAVDPALPRDLADDAEASAQRAWAIIRTAALS